MYHKAHSTQPSSLNFPTLISSSNLSPTESLQKGHNTQSPSAGDSQITSVAVPLKWQE